MYDPRSKMMFFIRVCFYIRCGTPSSTHVSAVLLHSTYCCTAVCSGCLYCSNHETNPMARPRPLDASTFILVLGTLLANRGGIEAALAPRQSRHVHTKSSPWLHERRGGPETALAAEAVPCDRGEMQENRHMTSLGARAAAVLRGGRSMRQVAEGDEEEEEEEEEEARMGDAGAEQDGGQEEEEEEEVVLYDEKAVEWMMQQLCMYQTRTALISKPLAAKGYKLREIVPSPRGLACAMSTEERRMDCRMYVEAEVGKKVVAPCKCKGTQKWISFSALNSERRKESTKWKHCPTCQGPIDYKLYEAYGGGAGKAVSAVLNNVGATRAAVGVLAGIVLLIISPLLHVIMVRVLTSGVLWHNYHRITFLIHFPLPFKIMVVRFLMKWSCGKMLILEGVLRQSLTDVESQILESRLPVTVEVDADGEETSVAHRKPS